MKVLVTGGAGFIGSHLVDLLVNNGHKVTVIDDLSTGLKENVNYQVKFFNDSIADYNLAYELIKEVDFVFHLASVVGFFNVINDPIDSLVKNIDTANSVFRAVSVLQKPCLFTSSSEVYADSNKIPMREDLYFRFNSPINIKHSYSLSKLAGEYIANVYRERTFADIRTVRLFNTSGSRQLPDYGMVLPRFVTNALKGYDINIYGTGNQRRSFCHVKDTVRALYQIMEKDIKFTGALNIGSDITVSIVELANLVINAIKNKYGQCNSKIIHTSYDKAYCKNFKDTIIRKPDLNKMEGLLGWKPDSDINEIIDDMIEYWKDRV